MPAEATDPRSALLAYATEVAGTNDETDVYRAMADAADRVLDFDSSVVETEENGVLHVRAWTGRPPTVDGIRADEGIAGATFQTGESERIPDIHDDPRVEDPPSEAPRAVISVPIGDVGVFQAGKTDPGGFSDDDLELAELLASHAGQAVERIRSQRDLEESEARFRELFDQASDALLLYEVTAGTPGRIRHVNDAAESLFDAPESELEDCTLAELLAADPDLLVPSGSESSFETGLADDSAGRVLDVTVKPFVREDDADAFAVVRDVTEQRNREQTLTDLHRATLRMVAADDPETVADRVVDAAKALIDLPYVGVFFAADDAQELRPVALSDDAPGDLSTTLDAESSLAWEVYDAGEPELFDRVSEHPQVYNPDTRIEEELIHPLGDHGVLMVGSPDANTLSDADVDLVRVLATNAEAALDRAERVRMLREREADLRNERNRLAALFENIPSPTASFVIEDGNPVVRSVNPAFERVFGYDEAELVGENIDEYIVPPDREQEAAVYNEKLRDGKNVNVEVRRLTEDGPRDFLLDVVPFRLDEPNVQGYAMYTDITDRKERERELERQNDRLEEFASIVSHDLRNPLNVARGYLELAEETRSDEHFERADEALSRMHDIIESVLALARQGRSLDDTEAVSLADAAERAWRNVQTRNATLHVSSDAVLDADPSRFSSLLENLFRNAVEHAGPDVAVTVAPTDAGFYVADDGPGIPEDRRDAVFESGKTWREDGTGFGLAIVKQIADAHGWTVDLGESETGGARFDFET